MSSSRRMIVTTAHPDRTIQSYPAAFYENYTPYKNLGFNQVVKTACRKGTTSPRLGKVVLVGDVAVGKTSLLNRFIHNAFDRDYKATIGVDFEVERFSILGTPFNFQAWDTAGAERFKCIAASYYRGANSVITVFDVASPASLENASRWMTEACENAPTALKFLVGSKSDLVSEQVFIEMELRAKEMSCKLEAELWTVSSLTGMRVKEFFSRVAALTFEKCVLNELSQNDGPAQQIGSLTVRDEDDSVYERKDNPLSCCS